MTAETTVIVDRQLPQGQFLVAEVVRSRNVRIAVSAIIASIDIAEASAAAALPFWLRVSSS